MKAAEVNSWGQLDASNVTEAPQQRALSPEVEGHIKALAAPDGEAVPLSTLRWLRASVREYVSGKRRRLDEVMGLVPPPSRRDWRTVDKLDARNAWLVRAFKLIDGKGEYKRCVELSNHIDNFQEVFWPDWEDNPIPLEEMTPLRRALFFAFKFGDGTVPRDWRQLKKIVQKPAAASCTSSILLHVHADAYDQSRSTTTINPPIHIGKSYMNILNILAALTLLAWESSAELRARHHDDLTDYHERVLRQAMDCDDEKGELPPLITEVLSQEQIGDMLNTAQRQHEFQRELAKAQRQRDAHIVLEAKSI